MEQQFVRISFTIDYTLLRKTGFQTIKSPFTFTHADIIYKAEYDLIMHHLKNNGINPYNVIKLMYETGMVTPFMVGGLENVTSQNDSYKVHIVAYAGSKKKLNKNLSEIEDIKSRFNTTITLEERKRLYRKLMLEYHPDKGGNLEITQFINSLKTW